MRIDIDASQAWNHNLRSILTDGDDVIIKKASGTVLTREVQQRTLVMDMRRPVVCVPARKLGHRFMAGEAHWILSGDNRVVTIAPYSKDISKFSDDGVTFFGAYGPKIEDQLGHVISKLRADPNSRQAGLTLWRENPPETKDYPCTIAMWFQIRRGQLDMSVFMRSSDAWLGVPYDIFNFSMVAHLVCCRLQLPDLTPGTLRLTAASSHLYESNFEDARRCAEQIGFSQPETPPLLYQNEKRLKGWLEQLKDDENNERWKWWLQ